MLNEQAQDYQIVHFEFKGLVLLANQLGYGSGPEMLEKARRLFRGHCFVEIVILAC
jgi:hypothetical protein